jgi:tRNA(Ile2) C34 agmatinyltransferase TiaS
MRTRTNCPECGKELDSVGLKGHRYYAHKIPYQSANAVNHALLAGRIGVDCPQ